MIELRQVETTTILTLAAGRANAIDGPFLDALAARLDQVEAEPPRALILTGKPGTFCAGLAIPTLIELPRVQLRTLLQQFTRVMRRVLELPFPTVAAISGPAVAGGCVLALMCDLRLMVDAGPKGPPRIGLNESQLGIGLPAVVVEAVRHKLPPSAFVPVALAGALFEGRVARSHGLVDEVVSPAELEAKALARAGALAAPGARAYAQIKRAWTRPIVDTIAGSDDATLESWLDTWYSDDGQARLRAIVSWLKKPGRV